MQAVTVNMMYAFGEQVIKLSTIAIVLSHHSTLQKSSSSSPTSQILLYQQSLLGVGADLVSSHIVAVPF